MVKRPGEIYAAKRLYDFLKEQGSDCAYEPGDDPPDYVFDVDRARWAVEVTELHDYVDAGGPQSVQGLEAGLKGIFDEIDRGAASSCKREYTIVLKGPIGPRGVADIKQKAIDHIRENRPEQSTFGENQECEISPGEGPEARLNPILFVSGTATIPGSTDLHADIQATVDYAVSRIVEAKVPKLDSLSGFDRRVLCVLSQYPFADDGNVRQAFSQHNDKLRSIDTVFVVLANSVASFGT